MGCRVIRFYGTIFIIPHIHTFTKFCPRINYTCKICLIFFLNLKQYGYFPVPADFDFPCTNLLRPVTKTLFKSCHSREGGRAIIKCHSREGGRAIVKCHSRESGKAIIKCHSREGGNPVVCGLMLFYSLSLVLYCANVFECFWSL